MSNFASNDNMTALFTAAGEKIGERAKIFPGSRAEWDALPLSEKIKYDYVAFAGDSQSGIVDNVPTEDSENLVKSGGVYDSLATKANLTQISNPNILHNPWFQVNQRGATSHTTNDYFVDRWRTYSQTGAATYTLNNDGTITIDNSLGESAAYFVQRRTAKTISRVAGRTITASVMFSDGTVRSGSGTYVGNATKTYYEDDDIKLQSVAQTAGQFLLFIVNAGKSVTIKALKLELGSISTLAMDAAPDMATELAKCQRYFQRLIIKGSTTGGTYPTIGVSIAFSATGIWIPIYLESSMRANPTLSIVGDLAITSGSAGQPLASTNDNTLTVVRVQSGSNGSFNNLGCTTSTEVLTVGNAYRLIGNTPNDPIYLDFNAEL